MQIVRTVYLTLSLLTGALVSPALAEDVWKDYMGGTWNNSVSAAISSSIWDDVWGHSSLSQIEKLRREKIQASRRSPITTTFPPGTERSILSRFSPDSRRDAAVILEKCDKLYAMTMTQATGGGSFALDDLASSTVFLVALNHYLYWDGRSGAPTVAQTSHMKHLREQLKARLLGSAKLAGLDAVRKRAVHDGFVLGTCLPFMRYMQAKKTNDESGKQSVRREAAETLKKVGLTPTSLEFKADGTVTIDRAGHR